MKKKVLLIVTGIILVLLLLPVPLRLDDGGSILYSAALYQVQDVKRLNWEYLESGGQTGNEYIEGIIVRILGFEVYNNTK